MRITELLEHYDDIFASLDIVATGAGNFPERYISFSHILLINESELTKFGDDIPAFFRIQDLKEVQSYVWDYLEYGLPDFPLVELKVRMSDWAREYTDENYPD